MSNENTIEISPEVSSANNAALASFFEQRSLVAGQRFVDAAKALTAANEKINELSQIIDAYKNEDVASDSDKSLAHLLRIFTANGIRTESAVDSLIRDASRVIANDEGKN